MSDKPVEKIPYVLGFMLNSDLNTVVLVRKARPAWQAGKLNGVGGRVEVGETYPQAMVREFGEETGVHTLENEWVMFGRIEGPNYVVYLFRAVNDEAVESARTRTDEEVRVLCTGMLSDGSLIQVPNLTWLVHAAMDFDPKKPARHPFFLTATYQE